MTQFFEILLILCAAAILIATALPLSRSHRWWIRALDFPRLQIAVLAAALLIPAWFVSGWLGGGIVAVLLACVVYQSSWILPYTPIWRKDVRLATDAPAEQIVTILSANVEMENDAHARVVDLIASVDPDILFLMETDAAWSDALAPHLARYPTVVREVRDDYWGMIFATRLEVVKAEAVYLTEDDTPTLFAELRCPAGRVFRFVGLHPQPPVPGVDTEDRDAEILYASRFARKTDIPLISMGDFNDVAWSASTRRFKRVGQYLDPRVGRGLVPSFDARSRLLRVPIDQFFVTEEVAVHSFERGPDIGSDHFPLIARVVTDPPLARRLNGSPRAMTEDDLRGIHEVVDRYRVRQGHQTLA